MSDYWVDPPALLDAAAWIQVAAEEMPSVKDLLGDAVGRVQSAAPVDIGSFKDRWSDELDIFGTMMQGFQGALITSAETYVETDQNWARLLGL